MDQSTDATRRSFLKLASSSALTSGFLIGCKVPGRNQSLAASELNNSEEIKLNAWIHISTDNRIIFYLDKAEMGQGVISSHTMMVGEELNTDPDLIEVRSAFVDPIHYRNKDIHLQMTAGSTSLALGFDDLRKAAAKINYKLRSAAASNWSTNISKIEIKDKFLRLSGTKKVISFGDIAKSAKHKQSIMFPTLKKESDFRFLGKSRTRKNIKDLINGKAQYSTDIKLPNMLSAVILRAPIYGAKLKSYDKEKFKQYSDVKAVVETSRGIAIVADTHWLALKASKKLIKFVTWENPSILLNTEDLRNEYRNDATNANLSKSKYITVQTKGQPVKNQGASINAVYDVPFIPHMPLEPMSCVADVKADSCDIWIGTQYPAGAEVLASDITKISQRKITIHNLLMGGSFGRRLTHEYMAEAVEISQKLQRPIKMIWPREDDIKEDYFRPMTAIAMSGSVNNKGEITQWSQRTVCQSLVRQLTSNYYLSANTLPIGIPKIISKIFFHDLDKILKLINQADPFAIEGLNEISYAIQNQRTEFVRKNPPVSIGAMRSIGHSQNNFFIESFIDELAYQANIDTLEFRLRNLKDSKSIDVLSDAVKKAGPIERNVYRGYAQTAFKEIVIPEKRRSYCGVVAEVILESGVPKLKRIIATVECGFLVNPDIAKSQIEGGIIFALSSTLKQNIEFKDGKLIQKNFYNSKILRMNETPEIIVNFIKNSEYPSGVGEVGVPAVAPAVCNAYFAATKKRIRTLPFSLQKA